MGAPVGNQNATKTGIHGRRKRRRSLSVNSFGKGFESAHRAASDLRDRKEALIQAQGREPTEKEVETILLAAQEEQFARVCSTNARDCAKRRQSSQNLTTAEWNELTKMMAEFQAASMRAFRDKKKILDRLHLNDKSTSPDPWADIDTQQANEVQNG